MLGKVKHFICNWFTFGSQTQGLKRERDLSLDDQTDEVATSSNHAPNNKKLRLMTERNQDLIQGMSRESSHPTKRDLETREQNWSQFLKPSALQTSTPIGSPVLGDAQLLKDHRVNPMNHNENSNHIGSKVELNQPLPSVGSGVHSVEAGSSLSQLEKLMAERLGGSAVGAKPKVGIFPMSEPASNLNFNPLAKSFGGQIKKNEAHSSSCSGNSPSKPANLNFRKKVLNGGVAKTNYRPMIQKLYGSSKQQKSKDFKISLLNTHSQSLAIQNCVRMEEKLYYKALLSQFVSKNRKVSSSTSSPTPSSRSSSGGLLDKIDHKEGQSLIQMQSKKSGAIIELDNESNTSDKTSAATILQSPVKSLARINTLEDALAQSPQYDSQFISNIKSRYSAKERERKRLLDEEAIRSKVLAENRAGWENDLEQRLRKQLEIVTRPVIDERVEEIVRLPEISEDMHKVIDRALNGHMDAEVLCDAFNLTITRRDLKTLAGLNWLNDQVINFYLTLVMERSNSGDWPKVFAFNTFFYPKLMSSGHAGLKRWTRKVDLFQQDFILVPVHLGLHWCLATVCPKEKAIRYYDSMGGRNIECLNGLKRYMEAESLDKKKTVLDTSSWKLECVENIPQQMNGSDCGMFTCKYAEYLSRRAKITFDQKDMPYFRRRMVYEIITQKLSHP